MRLPIGIHTGQQDATYAELRRVWRWADRVGFAWLSVWDHMYETPPVDGTHPSFETVSILTALAAETRQVRIGCLVMNVGYRNPGLIAKSACTIDHISKGRMTLGLGAGWHEMEYAAYGYTFPPPKVRLDMLEEGIQVVRSLLTQEVTTFRGKHFQVVNAYCNPKPLQPRLPIWVGGQGERRTLRVAARYADGWNCPYVSPEDFARKCAILEEWCRVEGRDPKQLFRSVNIGFYMGADEADAQRKRDFLRQQWGAQAQEREGGMLTGSPQEAIERIHQYVEAGAQQVNIALRAPFDWRALRAFAEKVLPVFA
ncbi:MAG: TIGR03560 family F420-dependent LLM class oxidoreductase [Dehalococcoidia bacterium]